MKSTLILNATLVVLASLVSGCSPPQKAQTDDAKKRAEVENVSTEQAAQYYTYRTYASDDGTQYQHVPDFFAGMDTLSVPVVKDGEEAMPDALLDKTEARAGVQVHSPQLSTTETVGRNTWMAWCAGNEGFWDWLCTDSLGFVDLLKVVDSRERKRRFQNAGIINEPGMEQAKFAREEEHGLWLDSPADEQVRRWRNAYLRQAFSAIESGTHKLQIGLKQKGVSGAFDGPPLYNGDPNAFKNKGYRYPSEYLSEAKPSHSSGYQSNDAQSKPIDVDGYRNTEPTRPPYSELDEIVPPPDLYGLSSGVIGLRLFPNPYFDGAAKARWDVDRYYNDSTYYNDPKLVRPFRVGMSCAFCHASWHPLKPPSDINRPRWTNISGNIGAQYLSMRATVGGQLTPDQFVYHLLDSQPRGTIDTSLIASDNINNPNTMNAVFGLPQRAILSLHNTQERLSTESSRLPSLWQHPNPKRPGDGTDVVPQKWVDVAEELDVVEEVVHSNDNPRHVPRILLDGSDSIGTWGALARVYLNIGSYWEQWNELHQVVVGFTAQRPFRLADCEEYSVYWNATEKRVPGLRDYFLRVTPTMSLLSTEGGEDRIKTIDEKGAKELAGPEERDAEVLLALERAQHIDTSQLAKGRQAFARNCIVCHSSIQPESTIAMFEDYPVDDAFRQLVEHRMQARNRSMHNGEYWEHDPGQWFENDAYQTWAEDVVEQPKFWTENYLSTDYRIPINVVNTNSARAMGTNGMTGHMWEDFASESYRELPSPGRISYFNPYKGKNGEMDSYVPRHINPNTEKRDGGGGPGYYRVPTLMSIWATAPLLHNNSLGLFNNDPSVDGRLEAFDDAIRKMLWPRLRLESSSYNGATADRLKRDHGLIWRTTEETYLSVDSERVPGFAHRLPLIAKLHHHRGLRWLHSVSPLWFPSAIILAGAMIVLLVNNLANRRVIAYVLFAAGLLFALVLWWVRSHPEIQWVNWLRHIQPWLLPVLVVVGIAIVLWLPLSRKLTRWAGYGLTLLSLLLGTVVYFNAGKLGDVRIGPIPAGTPVNLLANFNSEAEFAKQKESVASLLAGLAEIESRHLNEVETRQLIKAKIAPALMEVNKCPDFVMDKGHYFPWFDLMTDDDKNALIELLKTL